MKRIHLSAKESAKANYSKSTSTVNSNKNPTIVQPLNQPIPVQFQQSNLALPKTVHREAAKGVRGIGGRLPHYNKIQRSFGRHDISRVQAYTGRQSAAASAAIGAKAYATGNKIAFAESTPDLHTAAHEAAHVIQQQAGVQLKGGIGESGDKYERHADKVADLVVRGQSAQAALDTMANKGSASAASQLNVQAMKRMFKKVKNKLFQGNEKKEGEGKGKEIEQKGEEERKEIGQEEEEKSRKEKGEEIEEEVEEEIEEEVEEKKAATTKSKSLIDKMGNLLKTGPVFIGESHSLSYGSDAIIELIKLGKVDKVFLELPAFAPDPQKRKEGVKIEELINNHIRTFTTLTQFEEVKWVYERKKFEGTVAERYSAITKCALENGVTVYHADEGKVLVPNDSSKRTVATRNLFTSDFIRSNVNNNSAKTVVLGGSDHYKRLWHESEAVPIHEQLGHGENRYFNLSNTGYKMHLGYD